MASFNNTIITKKGHALIAKIVAGTATPNFTKIRTSDHQYPSGTNFEELTNLSGIKQTVDVASVTKVSPAKIRVSGVFTNNSLQTGYYVRNIGLYALDPDEGEILYSVTSAIEADWMPPQGGIAASSILVDIETVVGNADNVSITVNPNATATVEMVNNLAAEIADVKGFIGYNENDIVGIEVDFKNKKFTRLAGAVGKNPGADFDSIKAFGGRRRCNLADDGTVKAYYGDSGYIENGSNGQVMVEQPKFYYKVVPLEIEPIADYAEVNTFKITAGCSTSGDLTIILNGVSFTVAVTAGDDINTVASKIRNATFSGWTTSGSGDSVIFTCNETGAKTTGTFNGGSTGVTATVTKTVAGGKSKGYHMRKARYYVSDKPKPGFKVHPAFVRNGVEVDKIYLSAYEGSIYDVSASAYLLADEQVADFTSDKLSSIAYTKPASGLTQNLTRANTRKLANNRGTGWQISDVLSAAVTQLLFIIEYASFNMQSNIGLGVVSKTDDDSTNMSELTGATTNLGNASGMAAGTNGLTSVSYRGEENPWGNIWKWMDGLNIEAKGIHQAYWADSGFADDIKTSPYKNCGFTLAKTNGYVSAFGYSEDCDFLFLPSEVIGASNLPVGDYFYQNHNHNGFLVALLGGRWDDGSNAGTFYWRVTNASSARYRHVGGRLLYVPQ